MYKRHKYLNIFMKIKKMLKFSNDAKTVTFNCLSVTNTIVRYIERVHFGHLRCL